MKKLLLISLSIATLAACGSTASEESSAGSASTEMGSAKFAEDEIKATVNVVVDEAVIKESADWYSTAGTNLMNFMKEHYKVLEEDGEIIDIKGHRPEAGEVWRYTINGAETNMAAEEYIVKDGDIIEWKIVAE